MIHLRKSEDRGHAEHGWLKSAHTFSFADYYDPEFVGFGPLRVINEDFIAGGRGFGTHGHRDMEILTYVVQGAIEHRDSMGSREIVRPGDVQRMTAGTGVQHSEMNPLPDQTCHLLQIWVMPEHPDLEPTYEQKSFERALAAGNPVLVASNGGREGSLHIHQDVNFYVCRSAIAGEWKLQPPGPRKFWLQVVGGHVQAHGQELRKGDAAAIAGEKILQISWEPNSEFLIFDLP